MSLCLNSKSAGICTFSVVTWTSLHLNSLSNVTGVVDTASHKPTGERWLNIVLFCFCFSFLISGAEDWQNVVVIIKEARVVALFKTLLSDFAWHLQMLEVLLNKLLWWLSFVKAAYQRKLDMTFLTYLEKPTIWNGKQIQNRHIHFFHLGET